MSQSLLVTYLRPHRGRVGLLALCLLSGIGLQLAVPQILSVFIDRATQGAAQSTLMQLAILFWAVALGNYGVNLARVYLKETVAWSVTNRLRADLAALCLKLDMAFHRSHAPGELIERIDGDVSTLARFFSELLLIAIANGLLLLGVLVIMLIENWQIGLTFTGFAAVTMALLYMMRNIASREFEQDKQTRAELFSFLEERLSGTEDVRANGGGTYTLNRLFQTMHAYGKADLKAYYKIILLRLTIILLFSAGSIMALLVGVIFFRNGTITLGMVYMMYSYMRMLAMPIEQLTLQLQDFQTTSASLKRIEALRQTPVTIADGSGHLPTGSLDVQFDDVTFGYDPEMPTLRDLSFTLPAGHTLGLLGRTGSGKTTIARLLMRFYDPQHGVIRLGERDIRDVPLSELRGAVALVSQDTHIFVATVRENLTFFDPTVSDEALLQVIDSLGLQPWFQKLPHGLDTPLEANQLSAGEGQLVALARVFLRNPRVIILDEASSRLDPETEAIVDRATRRLLKGRTGIIIAHRLTTIRRVDQVLVLRDGQILEQGERQTLQMAEGSVFNRLLHSEVSEVLA